MLDSSSTNYMQELLEETFDSIDLVLVDDVSLAQVETLLDGIDKSHRNASLPTTAVILPNKEFKIRHLVRSEVGIWDVAGAGQAQPDPALG